MTGAPRWTVRPEIRRHVFVVEGDPVPKGRPRMAVTSSGKAHAYTPKRTAAYEDEVGNAWIGKGPRPPQFPGPVRVLIAVRERVYAADLDNYVKVVLDALNGLAWADDKQVEVIHATIERKHPYPSVTIEIVERPGSEVRAVATDPLSFTDQASQKRIEEAELRRETAEEASQGWLG